jgi:phosphate transport system permease protein
MANAEFSLNERDKARYLKDRLARLVVKSGGISILAAILLIFFYLVSMVTPIFSSAEVSLKSKFTFQSEQKLVGMGLGDYGENAFLFDELGRLTYIGFEQQEAKVLSTTQIVDNPSVFAKSTQSQGWYAYADSHGEIIAVKPEFNVSFTRDGRVLTPDLKVFNDEIPFSTTDEPSALSLLAFSINDKIGTFVSVSRAGVNAVQVNQNALPILDNSNKEMGGLARVKKIGLPTLPDSIDQIFISPDGNQLFVLSESALMVARLEDDKFEARELVDLSRSNSTKAVKQINLLSGAHSVLVTHADNTLTQWFDVLIGGERVLTQIREFSLNDENEFLLTDTFRKGFYSFNENGSMDSFYTTSENELFSGQLYPALPDIVSISNNESYLLAVQADNMLLHKLENPHPEVSFSSLWREIWYESYPEPQYVWQSTSASDDFEAKLSLVPIAFGTLKATFYAMLFSVPLAVCGAIYTAYFMSSSMRKVVKPSIEIMEALPTVIIGFLAGLWLAPIVETYLTGVVLILIAVPISALLMSILWAVIPRTFMRQLPIGWHVVVLIPVILATSAVCLFYSVDIERWLFEGDIRLFLADQGLSYDQRNALVVGIAMGFAVIPTIFTIAEDAIFSVPKHLSDGSLALGATQWQTLLYVVLLTASPGIFSAVMIGLGRAVGETMIMLMATGNTPIMDFNIFEGMRSLAATIAVEMPESEVGGTHYRVLFLAALVLFLFTFAVNSLAELVRQRLKERYSAM